MPLPSPSPAPTITVMEIIPQAMPNIVSIVRRLCAQSVASVSRSRSRNDMAAGLQRPLLQDDLLLLVQAFEDFRLHAIRNAELDAKLFLAVVRLGIGDLDRSFALLVVNQRGLGNHQNVFLFFEQDLRVGAHIGL